MRNSKIVALVATAALLVLGAAFTSFAATYNWYQEDGIWHCKDKNGDDYTDAWAKSGSDMYYLDENGEMVVETFLDVDDNYYYVDADGKMVKNQWEKIENTDDDDGDDYYWYYFQASGKAKKGKDGAYGTVNKPVSINGKKYVFDTDGKMQYGWIGGTDDDYPWEDAIFYAGDEDDGAVRTGWAKIDVNDRREDFEEQSYWFWFGTNGQKFKAPTDNELAEKSINGKKYAFDECGVMKAEWGYVTTLGEYPDGTTYSVASDSIEGYAWFQDAETGAKLKKGWFRVIPKDLVDATDNEEETAHWYYAKGSGILYKDCVKTINGKKYAFNTEGEMLAGLFEMTIDNNGELTFCQAIDTEGLVSIYTAAGHTQPAGKALYFFGDEETDGAMKYGTVKTEIDGDEYTFLFNSTGSLKGQAVNGLKGNAWYVNGAKLKADADLKYQPFYATFTKDKTYSDNKVESITGATPVANHACLISTSGAIVKNGTKKDADEHKWVVKNYVVETKDGASF